MEDYIQITKLNDFIFCPKSLYFHGVFDNFDKRTFHAEPQTIGRIKHESVDEGSYSTSKHVLQGTYVFSDRWSLCGKIDVFDIKKGLLTERKYQVKQIYQGFKYQLYAQKVCLEEMGYQVKKMRLYSYKDNKNYEIELPSDLEMAEFEDLITRMRHFNILTDKVDTPETKCQMCIYKPLCH